MKVIGINGSPNLKGNTFQLIEMVFDGIKEENDGVQTEIIQLAGKTINSCLSCYKCFRNKDNKCVQKDDLNSLYNKLLEADAIILGTPVYFGDATGKLRCFIERAGFIALANKSPLTRKIGAIVIAKRRQGGIQTLNTLNFFFYISGMIVAGYALAIGTFPGEVQKDTEGKSDMRDLGKNVGWLLNKLRN
ncbi:MAG: flavodoxin family protein [Promethearchaeota archaeon]